MQGVLRGRGESRVMHGLFRWAPEQDCFFFFSQTGVPVASSRLLDYLPPP